MLFKRTKFVYFVMAKRPLLKNGPRKMQQQFNITIVP